MDFGHPSRSFSPGSTTSADVKMSGAAAFGMLYLPVPVVSVYAKAGLARLHATSNVSLFLPGVGTCAINNPNCAWFSQRSSATNTSLAAGAGAQVKLGAWALRAEYERFNVAGGNPGLASLAATWTITSQAAHATVESGQTLTLESESNAYTAGDLLNVAVTGYLVDVP